MFKTDNEGGVVIIVVNLNRIVPRHRINRYMLTKYGDICDEVLICNLLIKRTRTM